MRHSNRNSIKWLSGIAAAAFFVQASACLAASTVPLGSVLVPLSSQNKEVGIGGTLTVWLPLNSITDEKHKLSDTVLFLDNRKLKTLHPIGADAQRSTLTFEILRNPDDRANWSTLLRRPGRYMETWQVSVGYDDLGPISASAPVGFRILTAFSVRLFGLSMLLLFVGTGWAGLYTGMLKDGPNYSLSRTQMAFWFLLIVVAFLFIALVAGDPNVQIPNSVLGLMGISAATGLAATAIDGKPGAVAAQTVEPPVPPDSPNPMPAQQCSEKLPFGERLRTFAKAMVSRGDTVDLDRLQIVVWTLVLGSIFVKSVFTDLAMPDFDNSLLGLMGISSGTYIGVKATK